MLTRVLRGVKLDTIDRRSQVGVALRRLREELTEQVGDPSPAEHICRMLAALGLRRRTTEVRDLSSYIREHAASERVRRPRRAPATFSDPS